MRLHLPQPDPRILARGHFTMMFVWAALLIPTLILWKESILWVAAMSLYANFVGHFSAWDAARAEIEVEHMEKESANHDRRGPRRVTVRTRGSRTRPRAFDPRRDEVL